jgi:hypothetical protein
MNQKKIIFVSKSINDYNTIKTNNSKIFTFDYISHKKLQELGISHHIAENVLDYDERVSIFNIAKNFQNWHNEPLLKKIELKEVNLLGLLDGIELHSLIIEKLIVFFMIKKILEIEKPDSIECSNQIKNMILLIEKNNLINIKINSKEKKGELLWDSINIKHNFMGIPISIKISRTKYHKLKNILDKTVGSIFGLWFNFKNKSKKTILILEMYPPVYKDLFQSLNKKDINLIIINQRRPVTYDLESIKILKKSNCKLISKKDLFGKKDLKEIEESKQIFYEKIFNFWEDPNLNKIFKNNDLEFWAIIKNDLKEVFIKRINEYVESIFFAKKIFSKINISCILSLYDIGETEKVFLESKNENCKSFLLEHGFSLFFNDSKTFATLRSYDTFRDNIVVWSSQQKQFLISNYKIDSNKIFDIGSPRHDSLIKIKEKKKKKETIQVLIAPTPIVTLQGFDTSDIHEKFENVIIKLCKIFENLENVKMVFKLHPSQSGHNNEIKQIIQKYSKKIPIYLLNPISELIQESDVVITITPEGWSPSTIILESMILQKPVMNIVLDEKMYEFDYIKQGAIIAIPHSANLQNEIKQILFDQELKKELLINSRIFVKKFLKNPGLASKKLADLMKEY